MSNWIVFREKYDDFLKCLWFSCDLWGFWWVERMCMLDGARNVCWTYFRIYLLHLEARSLLIGYRNVSNWIVFREKSESFLKCLWFNVDLWGFWWVDRKCMFDSIQKCVLKMIYNNFDCVYRREVFWLVIAMCQIKLSTGINLIFC